MSNLGFLRGAYRLGREVSRRSPHLAELADVMANPATADPKVLRKHALNLALPGLGDHTERLVGNVGRAIQAFGRDVAAEGDDDLVLPWGDFGMHLNALPGGLIVILGAKGFGKSELLFFLADKFRRRRGYPVETVNVYPEERPPWATAISIDRVISRVEKIVAYIGQEQLGAQIDDGMTEEDLARRKKKRVRRRISEWEIEKLKYRITAIDEGKALFSSIAGDQQASREALRNLINQLRHMKMFLIVAIQKLSELPEFLQDDAIMFLKWAPESMIAKDGKEGQWRQNREIWTEALAALNQVSHSRYYEPPFDTIKAWSYVRAGNIGGHTYYGLAPNTTWRMAAADDEDFGDPNVIEGDYEVLDGE